MQDESKGQAQKELRSGTKATDIAREVSALRRAWYQRITEAHQRGEFVCWTMWGVPEEIMAAFDVLPVLAENYGPVCAAKQIGSHFCQVAESDGYSMDLCSYLRTGLGLAKRQAELGGPPPEAPYGGMGKADFLIGLSLACNGRYKWLQEVARYLDIPFFCYDVRNFPGNRDHTDEAMKRHYIEHYYEQLKMLVAFLERMTGRKLDKNRLSQHLDYWMKSHTLFREACQLRKKHPNPLPAQDSATIAFPNTHFKAYPEAVDFYQKVYDEVKYRAENNMSSVPGGEKYRLYWYRILPWYYLGLYNWLEGNFGATTMNEAYDPGEVPPQGVVDLNYPLESIARRMYEGVWGVSARSARTTRPVLHHDDADAFVREYSIDGAICMLVNSCRGCQDTYHSWKLLRESTGIPTLTIQADMVDDRTYSDALVKNMLAAFIEVVDTAKRERHQA
ncbi:2-hydroxyacyl-CoA dehydratase subunit D [Chloroflexota bacterium]